MLSFAPTAGLLLLSSFLSVPAHGVDSANNLRVVENFLKEEEVGRLQSKFQVETSNSVYGYGKVDIPNSLVERVKALLEQEGTTSKDGKNSYWQCQLLDDGCLVVLVAGLDKS